jgi:hypothetical protein
MINSKKREIIANLLWDEIIANLLWGILFRVLSFLQYL